MAATPRSHPSQMRDVDAYVALGSNLGDRESHLAGAIGALRGDPEIRVEAISTWHETAPVGPPPQGSYLNGVVHLRTSLAPRALLERLLAIERAAGRTRSGPRWSARSLDLDLLFYGSLSLDEPGLRVPHPRLHERAFVLEPLCELAPQLVHPLLGRKIEDLARSVRDPLAVVAFRSHSGAPASREDGPLSMRDAILRFIESGQGETLDPQQLLTWGLKTFAPKIALSCSFGAPEGLVLLDMMHRIDPTSRVFVLDTGRLPQATHDLIDRVRERYDKPVEVVFPEASAVEAMVKAKGMNLFYESIENRQLCCRLRKVEPLNRFLSGLDAWVTGLRRDQGVTREETAKVHFDAPHGGIVKLNPIADWTHEQVLAYVRTHDVPTNRLHAAGYPSVGCDPCSRAIAAGDDPRAGRWWWESPETRECGIHVDEQEKGSGI